MTPAEIAIIVNEAAAKHGVSPEALMAIADLESSGRVDAQNPSSSASGLFQFVDSTAREYGLTGDKRNDPVAQADAAAKMMATNQRSLERSLGRAVTPGELYLAHQQGLGGARALLANPNRPAVDVLASVYGSRDKAARAIQLNGGNPNQSAGQFSGQWVNKANQRTAMVPPAEIPNVVASQTDTTRPVPPLPQPRPAQRMVQGTSQSPTSAASRAVPTMNATPRLAPAQDGIFAYTPPDMQPAQIAAGRGSLTPDFFRPQPQVRLPELPPPSAQTRNVPMPRLDPRLPNRMDLAAGLLPTNVMRQELQLQGQSYAGQERGSPSRQVPTSVVNQGVANAQAATNPALAAAMARSTIPAGMPTNMRSRDSVAQAAMGAAYRPPSTIPGPASLPKDQTRLTAGVYPMAPTGVGSQLSVLPPLPVGPAIAPRQAVTGFPTSAAMRPMPQVPRQSLASLAMPTPVSQRPAPQPTMRVTVNGAGSYGGGAALPPPQTFQGSRTGQTYTEGQRLKLGNDTVRANADGSFTNERTGKKVASGTGWQALHGLS